MTPAPLLRSRRILTRLPEGNGIGAPAYSAGGGRPGPAHGARQAAGTKGAVTLSTGAADGDSHLRGPASGKVDLEDLIEISTKDEAGGERKRAEAMQGFTKVAKLNRDLQVMEKRLASTPHRHVHVRSALCRKLVRLRIKFSQAIRESPFSSPKWTTFGSAFKSAAVGSRILRMRRWLKTMQQGEMEAERAKQALVEANLRLVRWPRNT